MKNLVFLFLALVGPIGIAFSENGGQKRNYCSEVMAELASISSYSDDLFISAINYLETIEEVLTRVETEKPSSLGMIFQNPVSESWHFLRSEYKKLKNIVLEIEGWQEIRDLTEDKKEESQIQLVIDGLTEEFERAAKNMENHLLGVESAKPSSVIMEILPAESSLFVDAEMRVVELYQMYKQFSERKGWSFQVYEAEETEDGARKMTLHIKGVGAQQSLAGELGMHRFEYHPASVGRASEKVSTTLIQVRVFPAATSRHLKFDQSDFKVETMRANGPGGQNVNKVESAVRITHLPTSISVKIGKSPSQKINKERAMKILMAQVVAKKEEERKDRLDRQRKQQRQLGIQRIRNYDLKDDRVTDSPTRLISSVDSILQRGELEEMIRLRAQKELQSDLINLREKALEVSRKIFDEEKSTDN